MSAQLGRCRIDDRPKLLDDLLGGCRPEGRLRVAWLQKREGKVRSLDGGAFERTGLLLAPERASPSRRNRRTESRVGRGENGAGSRHPFGWHRKEQHGDKIPHEERQTSVMTAKVPKVRGQGSRSVFVWPSSLLISIYLSSPTLARRARPCTPMYAEPRHVPAGLLAE